jgi:plasmid stabilization system protein ParE
VDYGYKISTRARRDLVGIWKYIANDDPASASCFCYELMDAAESLKLFPYRHGSFIHQAQVRKYPYRSYLIFYDVNEQTSTVEILRFWHCARSQYHLRLREENAGYLIASSATP